VPLKVVHYLTMHKVLRYLHKKLLHYLHQKLPQYLHLHLQYVEYLAS
jgi:hypothetical protein